MDHIALGMPMLILTIPEDLDELFQNGSLAAVTLLGELGRVVVVAVDAAFVFIVRVLCAEDGRTNTASKMFDVVFPIQSSDV